MVMKPAALPRGRWIPWVFVGGMLLVVVVNMVLVFFALTTFTGVTTGRAYDRGRTYNDVIAAASRQAALGWAADVQLRGASVVVVVVKDRTGIAVPGRIEGRLLRPLEGTTLPLDFAATATGTFRADIGARQPGQWDAVLRFFGPDGQAIDIRQRMILP
ncbi:MAG: FixH family protein [Roseomonas sp.]|nr:FixH family protein [Roseomonas sp.]